MHITQHIFFAYSAYRAYFLTYCFECYAFFLIVLLMFYILFCLKVFNFPYKVRLFSITFRRFSSIKSFGGNPPIRALELTVSCNEQQLVTVHYDDNVAFMDEKCWFIDQNCIGAGTYGDISDPACTYRARIFVKYYLIYIVLSAQKYVQILSPYGYWHNNTSLHVCDTDMSVLDTNMSV